MGILDRLLGRKQKQPVAALALNASRAGFMDACVRAWADLEPSKPLEEFENDLRDLARFTNAVTGAPRQHGSPAAKPAGGLAEIHVLAHSLMGTTDKETQLRLMQELTAYFENMTDEELASYWDDTLQLIEIVSDDPSLMLITVFAPHLLPPEEARTGEKAVEEARRYKLQRAVCPHCAGRRETLGWLFGIPASTSGYVFSFVCEDHKGAWQASDKRFSEKHGLDYEGDSDQMGEPVEVKCVLCLTSKGSTHADPNKGSWWYVCNDCEPRARELIETAEA